MGVPRVAEALARLAVFAVDDFSVDDMLHRLAEVADTALAVDGVGVMGTVGVDGTRSRFVHASRLSLEPLERLQELNQAGPCKDAMDTSRAVACSTQAQMERWPEFAAAARDAGVHSVVAVPMISRSRCWGVLDLYWLTETTLDDTAMAEVQLLADVAVSYLVIADDRHEADLARRQLAARLLHDTLTGLANRELIHELTYHALANANRRQRSVALLFIDLDDFKEVNDTRGHRAGDIVLRTVAHRMRTVVRASDTVSRLSGDEFLILCEDLTDDAEEAGLVKLGERIIAEIARPITVDAGPPVVMGASIGIAVTAAQPSVADFIHDADQAMYAAKNRHRNRIVVHHHPHHTTANSRRTLERQIFGALDRDELRVFFQPIVSAANRVVAVEALLRWQHPTSGLLPASDFIDFAASTGTIVRIGQWMIGEVARQLRAWSDAFPDTAPTTVFLNLSPLELIDQGLNTAIEEALRDHRLPAAALGIEITENALADTRVQPSAAYYQAKGHALALDDFGTGYSSLARLIELPVTYLKLDRLLVARLPGDPQARALLQAILVIADTMNLKVIGEGVENDEQAAYLTRAGCDLQQGFHHGRPQSAADLTRLLQTAAAQTVPHQTRGGSAELGTTLTVTTHNASLSNSPRPDPAFAADVQDAP
jgi:diguanylate cyclase (GGDEF)-like protein